MFEAELPGPIDRDARTVITSEVAIYEVSHPDNEDGTYNEIYKSKVCGATEVQQGDKRLKGKSKRSNSTKLRHRCYAQVQDEGYYDWFMNGIMMNFDDVEDLLVSKIGSYEG